MKPTLTLACIYSGKPSLLEVRQGSIDIQFKVGRMTKFDSFTAIRVEGQKVAFHGLYRGSILNKIELSLSQAKEIGRTFDTRVYNIGGEAHHLDSTVTEFRVAACGELVYDTVINKRADNAKKRLHLMYTK